MVTLEELTIVNYIEIGGGALLLILLVVTAIRRKYNKLDMRAKEMALQLKESELEEQPEKKDTPEIDRFPEIKTAKRSKKFTNSDFDKEISHVLGREADNVELKLEELKKAIKEDIKKEIMEKLF